MAQAPITPAVLAWALGDAGVDAQDLGSLLETNEVVVRDWLAGKGQPSLAQLDGVAKLVRRPRSFFFLPRPPERRPVNTEFRTYQNTVAEPGPETITGIELAQRVQKATVWVRARLDESDRVAIPIIGPSTTGEAAAATLRDWLAWNVRTQTSGELTEAAVTRAFRNALENRHVLVLHLTLDANRTRGFSLADPVAPLIAVNTREGYRARLFTYAHELSHLSVGGTAVCAVSNSNRGVEQRCNKIAAALLMPPDAFARFVKDKFGTDPISSLEQVKTIRNRFKVSLRASAIRAESLGLATKGLYDRVDAEAEYPPGRRSGTYVPGNERTRPVVRVDEYGREFVNTLGRAEEAEILRRRQVADLLRVSDQELRQVEQLAFAGAGENT